MGPPSDNIEFFESDYFKKATSLSPELRDKVFDHIRCWPNAGVEIARGVMESVLIVNGKKVVLIHRRRGNRLGLLHLFLWPEGSAELELARRELTLLYGAPKRNGG